ncbi:MAG: hypothetical protein RSG53_10395 [Oscillospiraceae bacterium]
MKRILALLLTFIITMSLCVPAFAAGEGNMDGGGGGMNNGSNTNFWNPGMDGVRVTIVNAATHATASSSIDLTNQSPNNVVHFGKVSKVQYNNGLALQADTTPYVYKNPSQALPRIIYSAMYGKASIAEIKSYFTDEQVIRSICGYTGFDYDTLVGGSDYKLVIEPVAYLTYMGYQYAMTATEAALYDQQVNGLLRAYMKTLTHKNLPLAIFLEKPDLGYPAWTGSTSTIASNADIISSLGIGIVRFSDVTEPPAVETYDYTYRVGTEVITAVNVSGGQSDPDNPVSVDFSIAGRSYTVSNVYYPAGDSQLAWVRWTTPADPCAMTITVNVHGGGSVRSGRINVNVVDLSGNDPPNPTADNRNDSFAPAAVPSNAENSSASWGVWVPRWHAYWAWVGGLFGHWEDRGWWEFDYNSYSAYLSANMKFTPDTKCPTASGDIMKSGYGTNQLVTTRVSTTQSSATTSAQTAVSYFPEFGYDSFWRLLERTQSGYRSEFEFTRNRYSTYNNRTHFTPIWYKDGEYLVYTYLLDVWTPAGMLSLNLSDPVTISGDLWDDWHIAPAK